MTETIAEIAAPRDDVPVWNVDPYSTASLGDLETWYDGLRARGRLVWLSRYGCWAIGHYDDVQEVFSDWKRFCSSRGVGLSDFKKEKPWRPPSIILETDPPEHTRARKVMTRAMSPRAVAALKDGFHAQAEALVDRLLRCDRFDASADFAEVFPLTVFPDAVGIAREDRLNLLVYGKMVFNALGPDNEVRREAMAAAAEIVPWIAARCAREALVGPGFGETIYEAADDGEITHEEAGLLVRSLLSAGVDTTVAALGAAMKLFAENPDQWDLLKNDPSLARGAFEEVLRRASPVHAFFRTTSVDTEIAGVPVREGDKVMCVLGSANNDPDKWGDPERFDITRRAAGHVAFGTGIHGCVGQTVARQEAEAVFTALAGRVDRIEALGPGTWRPGNALRLLDSMPTRFHAKAA